MAARATQNIDFLLLEFLLKLVCHIPVKLGSVFHNTKISDFHIVEQAVVMVLLKLN